MAKATTKKVKLNAGHVEWALRSTINYRTTKLIPEASIPFVNSRWDVYRADYVSVNSSGFATEYEVKISASDWKNDLKKAKWDSMPPWITRFIYVVPDYLGIPEWVPPQAGIWHIVVVSGRPKIVVVRAPKRIGKEKVPQETVDKWLYNLYFRYWNMRIGREKQLPKL